MNKLEQLLHRLCPNGVEYKTLSNICTISRGVRVIKNQLTDYGKYPVYQNSMTPLGYYDKSNCAPNTAFIISAGAAGEIGYSENEFWAADDCLYFQCPQNLQSRFLYFALLCQQDYLFSRVRKASVPRLSRTVIEQLKIPIPSLPVQVEIVRILDNFTELAAELTAELMARKKQYEYYQNQIFLKYINKAKFVDLSSIADVRDGTHDSPKPSNIGRYLITSKNVKNGTINFDGAYLISENDYNAINARSKVDKWDLLFTMIGTVGEVGLVCDEPEYAIKNVGLIKTGDELLSRFLKHYLTSKYVKTYVENNRSKGSQVFLALGKLRNLPVPSLTKLEQEEIVSILDRFDKLCNDLTEGLPAEIAARQKQYEYYRDKLLTFKETQNV